MTPIGLTMMRLQAGPRVGGKNVTLADNACFDSPSKASSSSVLIAASCE